MSFASRLEEGGGSGPWSSQCSEFGCSNRPRYGRSAAVRRHPSAWRRKSQLAPNTLASTTPNPSRNSHTGVLELLHPESVSSLPFVYGQALSCMDPAAFSLLSHGCWSCKATRYLPGLILVMRAGAGWNTGASSMLSWADLFNASRILEAEHAVNRPSAVPRV